MSPQIDNLHTHSREFNRLICDSAKAYLEKNTTNQQLLSYFMNLNEALLKKVDLRPFTLIMNRANTLSD